MNEKERELIGILKKVIIPRLKERYEENEKIVKEGDEENRQSEIAWYHAGWNLGIKEHIEECENVIRWFEGDKKKGDRTK